MQRIGILTYHHVANWGSVLQAVCLQKLLQRLHPRAHVEIVDYVPSTSARYNAARSREPGGILGIFGGSKSRAFRRKRALCQRFLHAHGTVGTERLCSDDVDEGRRFLERGHYDAVVVGSDTVFQLGPNFGGVHLAAPPAPNLYFLPFDASYRKLAIAVSVNPFDPVQLELIETEAVRRALGAFEHVFYRDDTTAHALRELGVADERTSFLPDPTLLVDFDALCGAATAPAPGERPAAVALGNARLADGAMTSLRRMGYEPVNLLSGTSASPARAGFRGSSVESFLALHRHFRLVVTDRFHGSIVPLVMGDCPLIGIEEAVRYRLPNSKLRDLYRRFGIEDMVIRHEAGQALDEPTLRRTLEKWQWSKVHFVQRIAELRLQAFQRLGKMDL